ncbi:MAG: hypothetical protein PVH62_09300 [Anaerolineae bacterium]|jgi:hypothetical protein
MRKHYLALLAWLVLLLAACGSRTEPTSEAEPATPTQISPISPLPEQQETSPVSPLPRPPIDVVNAAVAHLASELDISQDEVTLLSVEAVQWSDTSLGCAQPGEMYAQVITPGYRVILGAGGEEYELHTDEAGQNVVLCNSRAPGSE